MRTTSRAWTPTSTDTAPSSVRLPKIPPFPPSPSLPSPPSFPHPPTLSQTALTPKPTDNCSTEDCDQPRAPPEAETDHRHCPTHRCPLPTCRNPRTAQGPYCTTHTCAGPNCSALCAGGGEPGSHARYCDRHRVCATQDCTRLCHTRENGVPASHCGMHYCRAEGCERERRGDEACVVHSCAEVGCGRRRNGGAEGVFCKGHECKSAGCVFRRRRGGWCAEHLCAKRGCEGKAEANGYCDKHQLCVFVGCERYRAVAGERILERCEYRESPPSFFLPLSSFKTKSTSRKPRLTPSADEGTTCASQSCTRKATPPHLFCPLHLCSSPACPNPTTPPLTLCPSHKCALPHCASPRWTGAAPSPFCAQHTCQYPSCGDRTDGATGRCRKHGRCRVEGCGRGAEGEGYCGEHRRRGCVGYQDQWAGWGVAI